MKREIFYRLIEIYEYDKDDTTYIKAQIELYPRYDDENYLENTDKKLESDLNEMYEDNKEYINQLTGKTLRDLAILAWEEDGKTTRAEKLQKLKMKIISVEKDYSEEFGILFIDIIFKPFMVPVFGDEFYHYGIVYKEQEKGN